MPGRATPRSRAGRASLLHDVLLEALDEPEHLGLLVALDLEVVERSIDVAQEHLPVALVDPESAVRQLHVASDVVQRATGGRAQEIDQELLFAAHAVFTAMLPEATQLRIRRQPRQQVVGEGRDPIVAAQTPVERIRHGILLAVELPERGLYRRRARGYGRGCRASRPAATMSLDDAEVLWHVRETSS